MADNALKKRNALADLGQGVSRGFWADGLGGPVDMLTTLANLGIAGGGYAGHKLGLLSQPPSLIENPTGGSEWIAQKMRSAGLLNDNPGSTADNYGRVAGGLLAPLTAAKAPQIANALQQAPAALQRGAYAVGEKGADMAGNHLQRIGAQPSAITPTTAPILRGMSKDEFLGSPRIVGKSDAADLRPKALASLLDAPAEPFMGGKFTAKYSADGAVVFDGNKPIASYNFGDTLTVDPKYRKRGIGAELVYQQRTYFPEPAKANTRNKVSQRIQENVWDRIQSDLGG